MASSQRSSGDYKAEIAELKKKNAQLTQLLEERSQVRVIAYFHDEKIQIIAVCDSGKEGTDLYELMVNKLEESDHLIPQDLHWRAITDLHVNEVHNLPRDVHLE